MDAASGKTRQVSWARPSLVLAVFLVVAGASAFPAQGGGMEQAQDSEPLPGLRLFLDEHGMNPKPPTSPTPKARAFSAADVTPDDSRYLVWGVTNEYKITWDDAILPTNGQVPNETAATASVSLLIQKGIANVSFVFVILCQECVFPWGEGVTDNNHDFRDPLIVLRPGSVQNFTVASILSYDADHPFKAGEPLRMHVLVYTNGPLRTAGTPDMAPEMFLAYGSPSAASGLWLPGFGSVDGSTFTEMLYLHSDGTWRHDLPPPGETTASRCTECNQEMFTGVPYGTFVAPRDLTIVGDAVLSFWWMPWGEGPPEARDPIILYWAVLTGWTSAESIKVQARIPGWEQPVTSGEPTFWHTADGDIQYAGSEVGLSLTGVRLNMGDTLSTDVLIRASYAPAAREIQAVHNDSSLLATLSFGYRLGLNWSDPEPDPKPVAETATSMEAPVPPGTATEHAGLPLQVPGLGRGLPGPEAALVLLVPVSAALWRRPRP